MCWRRWGCRPDIAGSTIRVSLGWSSTEADIDHFLDAWTALYRRAPRSAEEPHEQPHDVDSRRSAPAAAAEPARQHAGRSISTTSRRRRSTRACSTRCCPTSPSSSATRTATSHVLWHGVAAEAVERARGEIAAADRRRPARDRFHLGRDRGQQSRDQGRRAFRPRPPAEPGSEPPRPHRHAATEHKCVLESCRRARSARGFAVAYLPVEPNGLVSLDRLAEALDRAHAARLGHGGA